jgi:membrane protease YdiL (CAAX protease family)
MTLGHATGLQIAFLAYAVMLLAVPIASAVVRAGALEGALRTLVTIGTHFFLASVLLITIPALRRTVMSMLRVPIPRSMRAEVAAVGLLKLAAGFGGIAALALWFMADDGVAWVERMTRDVDRQVAHAYTGSGIVFLLLSSTLGPIVEEVVFRGFIYRAFERQWGWIASLVVTSSLFGIYHTHFWSAFTGSVLMICVLRRTGSLRAPILVHMLFNFLLWPPLLGQYIFPRPEALADPSSWFVHATCLAFAVIAVPLYIHMSRDPRVEPTMFLEPDGALQK